ncbi:hypothetical protein LJB42_000576 [Komagataella kurtzmanii]|nr:hypothetical protein LJB42_000576 [Komagataella kurtzmanii]
MDYNSILETGPSPKLKDLNEEIRSKLQEIPDYPLDFNIFVYRGVKDIRTEIEPELKEFRVQYNNQNINDDPLTCTARLQDRLLGFLILERHRRDIETLNKTLEAQDSNGKTVTLIELQDPYKYEIKSPLYLQLMSQKDSHKQTFHRVALLQNLEYQFESKVNPEDDDDIKDDNSLIQQFVSNEEIMNFDDLVRQKLSSLKDAAEAQEAMDDSTILQLMIPVAAQKLLVEKDSLAKYID